MGHLLVMVYAMMKQTILSATLTMETVVELVLTQIIVQNVFVMMKQSQYLIFHVLRNVIIRLMNPI